MITTKPQTTDADKFSNIDGVLKAMKRAALHLLPPHDDERQREDALANGVDLLQQAAELARRAAEQFILADRGYIASRVQKNESDLFALEGAVRHVIR
jgi:hypothetical protein